MRITRYALEDVIAKAEHTDTFALILPRSLYLSSGVTPSALVTDGCDITSRRSPLGGAIACDRRFFTSYDLRAV